MARERTFVLFPGLLRVDQTAGKHRVGYGRLVKRVERSAQGLAPVGTSLLLQLRVAEVSQAEQYDLPSAQQYKDSNVSGDGLAVPADTFLDAIIAEPAGVSDLVVWIESEATVAEAVEGGWATLTAGMLQARFASDVYNAVAAGIVRLGQSDPVPQILSDVTEVIRGAVRSGGKVALGPVGTMPASARRYALMLAKADLISAVQDVMPQLYESAKKDAESAESYLKDLRRGQITPEPPVEIAAETPAGPSPSFTDDRRKFTGRTEDGI